MGIFLLPVWFVENTARLFLEINSGRMRSNRHRLQHSKGNSKQTSIRTPFLLGGSQIQLEVPREAVKSLSLKIPGLGPEQPDQSWPCFLWTLHQGTSESPFLAKLLCGVKKLWFG